MNRILVIRGGAIGDFILALPAIKLLRDAHPSSHLEILGSEPIIALAENRFYAAATRSLEDAALSRFFWNGADLPEALVQYFGSFDLIVSYLFDPDGTFAANLRRCGTFEFLVGPAKANDLEHAALQLAAPLAALGLHLCDRSAKLFPSSADRVAAREFIAPFRAPIIAIHPGSGSEAKNWPIERWEELGTKLLDRSREFSMIVFGGEADGKKLEALRRTLPPDRAKFAQDLPLPTVAAIAEACALFIGHDSGISHLAAAVGTPALLLFGPTDPRIWAPTNANVRVLPSPTKDLRDLPIAEVECAAYELMRIGMST